MQILGVATGPDVDPDAVVDPIVKRLEERGSVGVVRSESGQQTDSGGTDVPRGRANTEYAIDGSKWTGRGSNLNLGSALDRLAPDHDYALVVGFSDVEFPTLVVGDAAIQNSGEDDSSTGRREDGVRSPETILEVTEPGAIDLDEVEDAVESAEPYETLESLIVAVKRSPAAEYAGAIATFTGRVRAKENTDDAVTEMLEFERYDAVAEERTAALEAELTERDGVQAVRLHHRTGRIEYGEDIVFVVVLAGHREEAFRTVEDGINRLKAEIPIFKKEVTVDEEFWVHERA